MDMLVRKPLVWYTLTVTEATAEADFVELYQATVPDGQSTVALYVVGTPKRFFVDVTDAVATYSSSFNVGDVVYFKQPDFAVLPNVDDYVAYDSVYVSPPPTTLLAGSQSTS